MIFRFNPTPITIGSVQSRRRSAIDTALPQFFLHQGRLPHKRLCISKLNAVQGLTYQGLTLRPIAAGCALGQGTVLDYVTHAQGTGPCYEDIANWPDEQLLASLGGPYRTPRQSRRAAKSNVAAIERELQADNYVALQFPWEECREPRLGRYSFERSSDRSRKCATHGDRYRQLPPPFLDSRVLSIAFQFAKYDWVRSPMGSSR